MSSLFRSLFLFYLLFFTTTSLYAIEDSDIPSALMEWKGWVLDELKERECPIHYQNNRHICNWQTKIDVVLEKEKLSFDIGVMLFKDKNQISLPNVHQSWAEGVTVDGKKAIILSQKSNPTVMVGRGLHHIRGTIPYHSNIKYLQLPQYTALVTLSKDGKMVSAIKVDQSNRLWLNEHGSSEGKRGSLTTSIYRKVIDGHPIKMETYLHFSVSGKMRRVVLDGIVLDGFLPIRVDSSLDATITDNKSLEVELKAGEWSIKVESYSPKETLTLHKPKYSFAYANQEIWSVQTDTNYRTIEIEGGVSIDPSQTSLPKEWRTLPTYLIDNDKGLTIKELYKSVKQQQKNELRLQREVWLDFDGGGVLIY